MQAAEQILFDNQTTAQNIYALFSDDVLQDFVDDKDYYEYRNDPVAFGEDILGEIFTDDIQEMMLSVRDNMITIAKSGNQTGKTHAAARVAVWWYKVFDERQVWTAAAPPSENLKKLLWGEIGEIVRVHPKLFKDDSVSSLNIKEGSVPQTKDFITGVTIPSTGDEKTREAKFSGKHRKHILFILDEGDAIPDEVYKGIESCMSGGHCRLLIMFNPRQKSGEAYRMIEESRANVVELSAINHPNVVTGTEVIPGAVDRETVIRRINLWTRLLAGEELKSTDEKTKDDVFEVPKFLVGKTAKNPAGGDFLPLKDEFRKIMNPSFSYMVLARYPAQGVNQLISEEWISRARSRWDAHVAKFGEKPPLETKPIMGLDAAEYGLDSNCAYFRYGGYVARPEKWNGVDMMATGDQGAKIYQLKSAYFANVDGIGVGAGVAPHMRRLGCKAQSVKVSEAATETTEMGKFDKLRDQLYWMLREWLRVDPGAMLPPEPMLIQELRIPEYWIAGGKIQVTCKDDMREKLKRSCDDMEGLVMTFADIPKNQIVGASGAVIVQDWGAYT